VYVWYRAPSRSMLVMKGVLSGESREQLRATTSWTRVADDEVWRLIRAWGD